MLKENDFLIPLLSRLTICWVPLFRVQCKHACTARMHAYTHVQGGTCPHKEIHPRLHTAMQTSHSCMKGNENLGLCRAFQGW